MAKKATFEIYEGFGKRKKKYLVLPNTCDTAFYDKALIECKRFFHCSSRNLDFTAGYILNNELYLGLPDFRTSRRAKQVCVVTYVR